MSNDRSMDAALQSLLNKASEGAAQDAKNIEEILRAVLAKLSLLAIHKYFQTYGADKMTYQAMTHMQHFVMAAEDNRVEECVDTIFHVMNCMDMEFQHWVREELARNIGMLGLKFRDAQSILNVSIDTQSFLNHPQVSL